MLTTLLLSLILSWSGLTPAATTHVVTASVVELHQPLIQEDPVPDFVHDGYAHRTTKRNYYGTLVDVCNGIKKAFGWENLDIVSTRRGAIWSSIGLLLVFIIAFYSLVFLNDKTDKNEKKGQRSLQKILWAPGLFGIALLVQNVMCIRYLVTALEFDFMVFGDTPFWPFVGAFIAIAAVIAIVFLFNVLLSAFTGLVITGTAKKERAKGKDDDLFNFSVFYGYILPIIGYAFIMLASIITFFNINILPFSFKVLRLGCILFPILTVVFAVYNKSSVLITLPFAIINGVSLMCLGIIIAFYVQTISLLSILAILGGIVISFLLGGIGGGGLPIAFDSGSPKQGSSSQVDNSFSMSNMEKLPFSDADGNEVFKRKSDGRLFKSTVTGFQEISEDEVQ